MSHVIPIAGIAVLSVLAAVVDLRLRKIPNALVAFGAGLGLVIQAEVGGLDGVVAGLCGLLAGAAVLLPGFLLRTTGAGDVKLMAALGTFVGPYWALVAALTSVIVGAALALAVAVVGTLAGIGRSPWRRYGGMLRCLLATGRVAYIAPEPGEIMGMKLPFAVSIAIGTLGTLWWWWPTPLVPFAGGGG